MESTAAVSAKAVDGRLVDELVNRAQAKYQRPSAGQSPDGRHG
ncbi:hypothetical protein SHXM_04022 [Streptomyces hygroscopicus]|nr:hypothetical protein SHXM_04022 [Streptomyces hygroscopicus]